MAARQKSQIHVRGDTTCLDDVFEDAGQSSAMPSCNKTCCRPRVAAIGASSPGRLAWASLRTRASG
eukprot:2137938-Pyramimonas_sp.AAC.1